jgi:hypothetical protein
MTIQKKFLLRFARSAYKFTPCSGGNSRPAQLSLRWPATFLGFGNAPPTRYLAGIALVEISLAELLSAVTKGGLMETLRVDSDELLLILWE